MKKLLAIWAGLLLAAALLVAAGCGQASPGETVDKAIQTSQDVKSEHIDFDVSLEVTGDASALGPELEGVLPLVMKVTGGVDADNTDPDNPKAKGTVSFEGMEKILSSLQQAEGTADAQTQLGLDLIGGALSDLEFVTVDKKAYFKVAGTWYELGDASAFDMTGLNLSGTDTNTQCYQDAMKDPAKFGSDKVFTNLQEVGEEKIDGTDTRHFRADIDLDKTLTALTEIARGCGDAEAAGGLEGGSTQLKSFFRTLQAEMWIDKDNNFRQVKINIEADPQALADLAASMGGSTGATTGGLDALKLNVTLKFSQFGAQFDITKPEGEIMNLEDLMSSSLGGSLGLGGTSGLEGLEGLEGLDTSTTSTNSLSQ